MGGNLASRGLRQPWVCTCGWEMGWEVGLVWTETTTGSSLWAETRVDKIHVVEESLLTGLGYLLLVSQVCFCKIIYWLYYSASRLPTVSFRHSEDSTMGKICIKLETRSRSIDMVVLMTSWYCTENWISKQSNKEINKHNSRQMFPESVWYDFKLNRSKPQT